MTSSKARFSRGLMCAGVVAACGAALSGSAWSAAPVFAFAVSHSFDNADGARAEAPPVLGTDGNYYGTTSGGGANNVGTVYKLTPSGTFTTLYSFTGVLDGSTPRGALVEGSDGNFYGATVLGGANGDGTIFEVSTSGVLNTLYSFAGAADGNAPESGVILGSDGNFYGTTAAGGSHNLGTVFKITPAPTSTLTTLYTFTGKNDGGLPWGGLTLGPGGNFYGATLTRGAANFGTVYTITPTGTFTALYSFSGGDDGGAPYSAVAVDNSGHLYGTAFEGGTSGLGTVYEIADNAVTPEGTATILHTFTGTDGANPEGNLLLGRDGNLYGTTKLGGANNDGTVFAISASGILNTLLSFDGSNGTEPTVGLSEGSGGKFYGTTAAGGANNYGAVYVLVAPPAITLTSSVNPSTYTQSITFTATASSPLGTPGGAVIFSSGAVGIPGCVPVQISGGVAQCTTSSLTAGTDTIYATYEPNPQFAGAQTTLSQVVKKAPTAMTATPALLELSPTLGLELLNLSATLTNTFSSVPVGGATIVFSAGGQVVCAAVTSTSGVANCTGLTPWLAGILNLSYTASFAGDANDLPSSVNASIISGL